MLPSSKIAFLCATTFLLFAIASSAPTNIFVSPSGSDTTGDGSQQNPFATVFRAQALVQTLNRNMQSDIFVYLREGEYFLPQPLSLTLADSATNGFTIHYAAWAKETAVLHAGVRVQNWSVVPSSGGAIWVASLPNGVKDTRQAYINGDRMIPTNTGRGIPGRVTLTNYGYTTTDPMTDFFNPMQNAADLEFLYTGVGSSWTECRIRVASLTRLRNGGTNITMQQPGYTLGRNRFYGQGVTAPASISNVYALLSRATPQQYYFDSQRRLLYYVPRPQDDMRTAVVIVPSADLLVQVQGTYSASTVQHVRGLSFEGLTFSYAGWLEPNSGLGYVDMQSGFRVTPTATDNDDTWDPVPANVQMHAVANVTVTGCVFEHLGAVALELDDGSQYVTITNNTFRDVSCSGVWIGQISDMNITLPDHENGYVLVHNNLFDHVPVEFRDCSAIIGGFMVHTNITHNSVLSPPNTGISLGWGWSRDQAANAGWNAIVGNFVNGSNWLLEDGGSIYVLGPQPQSIMAENYAANQVKLYGALYTDEGSAYWHITRCVVNNCPEWLHIWTPSIHDELVDFCWTNQPYQDVHGTRITISNITLVAPGAPFPPEAQAVMSAAGVDWMAGPK